jgi:cystathionine beta-lyase/cystathionine gamma-synthase
MVMCSATKYIGGHSDIIMGGVTTSSKELNDRLYFITKTVGAVPSPMECFMAIRSLKTLKVRMIQHCKNAMIVAEYLENHPKCEKV